MPSLTVYSEQDGWSAKLVPRMGESGQIYSTIPLLLQIQKITFAGLYIQFCDDLEVSWEKKSDL